MQLSRRSFVKASALAAALAAAGCTPKPVAPKENPETEGATWYKTVCRYCGVGCGVMVAAKDNRVVAVKGDTENPVNKGLLCVKGYYLDRIMNTEEGGSEAAHPQERPAHRGLLGRSPGPGGREVPRGGRPVRARFGRLLRLRPEPRRGDLHRQQALQGLHRHQQRRGQPPHLHGLCRGGLRLHVRQGRADGQPRRHRARRHLLYHRLQHHGGAPHRLLPHHHPEADGQGRQGDPGRPPQHRVADIADIFLPFPRQRPGPAERLRGR